MTEAAANSAANGEFKAEVLLSAGHNVVLVLDYGSQYTQLIARRVREIGLLSILLPGDVTLVSLLAHSCSWESTSTNEAVA
jgi:hypothetical protein